MDFETNFFKSIKMSSDELFDELMRRLPEVVDVGAAASISQGDGDLHILWRPELTRRSSSNVACNQ
jgi:hypothetical protein